MPHGRRLLVWLLLLFAAWVVWLRLHKPEPAPSSPASQNQVRESAPESIPNTTPPPPVSESGPLPEDKTRSTPSSEPMVQPLGNGRFRVGAVEFSKTSKTITIPASVNMLEGPVEYVLVMKHGKFHESVFVTDADARDVHVAALLLGMVPEPQLGPENSATTVKQKGAVSCWVEWDRNGPPARIPLHELVSTFDPATGVPTGTLNASRWLYNGSRVESGGVFAATQSGSVISIIRDPEALINNPDASRDNDDIHTPNAVKLPKLQHPVRIVLKVE